MFTGLECAVGVFPRRLFVLSRGPPPALIRSFGYAVSHATVREGVRRGRRPIWITEIDSHGSRRIAERMGFKPRREYVCFDHE